MIYPERFRFLGEPGGDGGAFKVPFDSREFYVIASHGGGWDHVSVSLDNRTPNWKEMCFLKKMFFGDESLVVQFHPPKSKYKDLHAFCLHMWSPHDDHIKLPPEEFV
jgi:hypothetical protein